ncbi:MAG: hypothetical protein WAX44_03295 [Minisyncoccia bacterium]
MAQITKDVAREIIEDFASDIARAKSADGPKPQKEVIDFRNEKRDGVERVVYTVPISLLRFRKENGRIASDVLAYEKGHGVLREDVSEHQKILAGFLRDKDPDTTEILKKSVQQKGQEDPAIITADGFLINGNRRKLVLEMLWEGSSHDPRFERMKVVILPGKDDPGGTPTNREIEQIENRYQLYKDGKSEYSNFDRALSVRRKIDSGMSLEEQLRDDPATSGISDRDFKKEVQRYQDEFLGPLTCADRYLEAIGREGIYTLISSGKGDRENRWQAFIDYYKFYKRLQDPAERVKVGVEEKEVGKLEAMAFSLIRLRDFSNLGIKLHMLIRKLPKYVAHPYAKKELLQISSLGHDVEDTSKKGDSSSPEELDKRWVNANQTDIKRQVHKAQEIIERIEVMETPITLLRQALDKLTDDNMDPASIKYNDVPEALRLAQGLKDRVEELRKEFYQHQKVGEDYISKNNNKTPKRNGS